MHSQRMTLIALSVIRCINYLAYGTIFTRAMFLPKKNLMFFPARKAVDERWEVVEPNGGKAVLKNRVGSMVQLCLCFR